jgi:hypothetical protein
MLHQDPANPQKNDKSQYKEMKSGNYYSLPPGHAKSGSEYG